MEIRINEQILDASLDNEKTIGDVITALDQWLSNSGHVLSGLKIDGQTISVSQINEIFLREINSVETIDIQTEVLSNLSANALINLLDDIKEYENPDFEGKNKFNESWKESAQANFISVQIPDLYILCMNTFIYGEITTQKLTSITEERIHEIKQPVNELKNIENALDQICEKLIDLPVDFQTGKDKWAAETIQHFTSISEKIIRIYHQIDTQGFLANNKENGKKNIQQLILEFTDILKEMLNAYERNDFVLVGDLAEYEVSVKIKNIYTAIMENCRSEK
jgi:hypothetical protein